MERGMERVASGWVDVLEWLSPLADGDEESVEVERERRTTYLSAVLDELEAVNSRRPTRFVYLPETAFTDAGVESEEERLREVERQEREKKEAEFEEWVESIMGVAGSQARRGEEGADEEDAREKRRRMLDQPMGGGGETFRKALRTQWDAMYDSSKGGVMGNVAREWGNIAAKYGGDEDKKHAEEGLPEPVQIMAAHHLRSQLSATLDLLRPRDSRFAYRKNEEAEILPPSMRGMTEEYMHVFQRAVKIDQRARRWADSLLDVLVPSSRLPSRVKPRQLDFKSRIHLLRASPLPSFLKSLNELFKLPSDPAHWRPSLSKHDLSNALFSLQEKALQGKVGEEARGEYASES
ncbi:plus agglutinin [Rhodotorula toruloides]|uniref:Plus agglutinin n=1 Tax=Rhodotorula toruloides TaxID=5286 RepID=A0A511KQC9_RHOTO|nr:plus agglutinin [Rhodotorula toruloides]